MTSVAKPESNELGFAQLSPASPLQLALLPPSLCSPGGIHLPRLLLSVTLFLTPAALVLVSHCVFLVFGAAGGLSAALWIKFADIDTFMDAYELYIQDLSWILT